MADTFKRFNARWGLTVLLACSLMASSAAQDELASERIDHHETDPDPVTEMTVHVAEETPVAPPVSLTEEDMVFTNGEFLELPDDGADLPLLRPARTRRSEADEEEPEASRISITLDDVEMVDVVRMFTRISGANIIATPSNLIGKVTVNLQDVEWRPALESILDMHNLALIERLPGTGVFSIIPRPPGTPEPMVVNTFFLKFASVEHVAKVVQSLLGSGGSVSPFPSRNAMVVRTTKGNLGEITEVIKVIDRLREQVYIEAKFMELNDQAIQDLGINWKVLEGYSVSAGNLTRSWSSQSTWQDNRRDSYNEFDRRQNMDSQRSYFDVQGVQFEQSETEFQEIPPGSGQFGAVTTIDPTREIIDTIDRGRSYESSVEQDFSKVIADMRTAVLGADDFRLVLSALKQMNGVSVTSNPKIIVANEEPATIHIGETRRPFESTVTPATDSSAPFITYNPGDPVDFGVKLTVVPTVNTASNITVKIEPELTDQFGEETAPSGQTYPIITTKRIQTVFCLESGKTVAIGGLTKTREAEQVSKVPLLGDIPIIGKYLFTHTHQAKEQQETIIFVTVGLAAPNGMFENTGMPQDTELARREMIRKQIQRRRIDAEIEELQTATEAELRDRMTEVRGQLDAP